MRASESDRAVVCPHSLVVPRLLTRRTASDEAAGYGHLVHHWKENGFLVRPDARWRDADVDLLERKLLLSGHGIGETGRWHGRDFWPGNEGAVHEVTFAVDLLRDEPGVLWYTGPRDGADAWKTSFGWEWLTGTCDWYDWTGPRDAVDDLKTSRFEVIAAESLQLKSYALVRWADLGCPGDYLVDASITNWPKYPLAAPPTRTRATWDAMDLTEHLEALRDAARSPRLALPGDHCTFCEGRTPLPISSWAQHYKYRAQPTCEKGLDYHLANAVYSFCNPIKEASEA